MLRLNPDLAEHTFRVPDGLGYFDERKALHITAREINGYLGRPGALWQQESFDRIARIVRYIANNPGKARMGSDHTTVGIAEACLGPAGSVLREDSPMLEGDEW